MKRSIQLYDAYDVVCMCMSHHGLGRGYNYDLTWTRLRDFV